MAQMSCLSAMDSRDESVFALTIGARGPEPAQAGQKHPWYTFACGLVLALSLALGIYRLGEPCLWFDEAAIWETIRGTWSQFWSRVRSGEDCGGCAHALVLRTACSLLGSSEFTMRLPSVLTGLGFVAVMLTTGHFLWGRRAAICVGLLAALHPEVICWSRQARAYSFEMLGAALCLAFLLVEGKTSARARGILLGAAASLVVLIHAFGVFFVVGVALFLLCSRLPWLATRQNGTESHLPLRPLGGALLLSAAWMVFMQSRIRQNLSDFWIKDSIVSNYRGVFQTNLPILPVYAALVLLGIALLIQNHAQARNRVVLCVFLLVILPVLGGPLGVSLVRSGTHNFILPRYFLPMIPLCLLPLGYLFSRLPSWSGVVASLGLGLCTLWVCDTARLYGPSGYDACNNRDALVCLTGMLGEGDRVIVYPGHQSLALQYYKLPAAMVRAAWGQPALQKLLESSEPDPAGRTWLAIYSATIDDELQAVGLENRPQWDFGNLHILQVK